jgi:hypothetical protein
LLAGSTTDRGSLLPSLSASTRIASRSCLRVWKKGVSRWITPSSLARCQNLTQWDRRLHREFSARNWIRRSQDGGVAWRGFGKSSNGLRQHWRSTDRGQADNVRAAACSLLCAGDRGNRGQASASLASSVSALCKSRVRPIPCGPGRNGMTWLSRTRIGCF